jgi:SAM-dependent methyltransferase
MTNRPALPRKDMLLTDSNGPSPDARPSLVVDDEELRFRLDQNSVFDVLFDGQRVWSISAPDYRRRRDGYRHAPWPEPIRPRLEGTTLLEMRDHVTGRIVAATEATFGSGAGRVSIVDENGLRVAVTKHGRFNRPFESTDRAAIEGYLDQVEEVLALLRDECGLPAFISYGTLLGAVRNGRLIGHDNDIDLGYLSAYTNPVDVIRESMRVERVLRSRPWRIVRQNGAFVALFLPQADGSSRNLDVFACFIVNGHLHQVHDIRTKADRSAVVPLRDIEFEGRTMPAPAKPEVLLRAAYGRQWRVPDPSFEYHSPKTTKRRINGWLGGLRARRDSWITYYSSANARRIPRQPSAFAEWVAEREAPGQLVDLGCGPGRDALYFADKGFSVTGVDFVYGVLKKARKKAAEEGTPFEPLLLNLYSVRASLAETALLARRPGPTTVYSRHLLDDLRPHGRDNFWRMTRTLVRGGGRCYLEFHTSDNDPKKLAGPSGQQPLDPEEVVSEARAAGATVSFREQGALDGPRDTSPHVCRLVLEW